MRDVSAFARGERTANKEWNDRFDGAFIMEKENEEEEESSVTSAL